MEMPNVIQNYERFRDKGLVVLAVSIDDKKDAWKNGIRSFGTPFVQLSELQGRNSRLCAIYGINTIPANLLIDPQGIIVTADLRGKVLTRKELAMRESSWVIRFADGIAEATVKKDGE